MASQIIAPNGSLEVVVPVGEKVAIATRGRASYSLKTGQDKVLDSANPVGVFIVEDGEETTPAIAAGGSIIVNNMGPFDCYVEVGTTPICKQYHREAGYQGDTLAVDVTGPISATAIMGSIVTSAAAGVVGTMPTGAVMDESSSWSINEFMDWSVVKVGAGSFRVAGDTGHTIIGNDTVTTALTGHFRTRKTAADTFVTYRIG